MGAAGEIAVGFMYATQTIGSVCIYSQTSEEHMLGISEIAHLHSDRRRPEPQSTDALHISSFMLRVSSFKLRGRMNKG